MHGNGSPTTMQTPRALGAERLQRGCGGRQTGGGGHTWREAFVLRPRGQRPRCDFQVVSSRALGRPGQHVERDRPGGALVSGVMTAAGVTQRVTRARQPQQEVERRLCRVPAEWGPSMAGRTKSLREWRGTLLGLGRGLRSPWLGPGGPTTTWLPCTAMSSGVAGADATQGSSSAVRASKARGHTASASSSVKWATTLGGPKNRMSRSQEQLSIHFF